LLGTQVRVQEVRIEEAVKDAWISVLEVAVRKGVLRDLVEAAVADPSISNYHDALHELLAEDPLGPLDLMPDSSLLDGAILRLEYVGRSRSPIVIALEAEDEPLDEAEVERTACHLTVTFTRPQVAALEETARAAFGHVSTLAELEDAGGQVWRQLKAIEPRLETLSNKIAAGGLAQPVAWYGRPALLAAVGPALQIAHTGRRGIQGFFSVGAGGHYFTPVPSAREAGETRTMKHRADSGDLSVGLADLCTVAPDAARAELARIATDVLIALQPYDQPLLADVSEVVRTNDSRPTRAVLAFGGDAPVDAVNALLAVVPFVSCADLALAGGDVTGTLTTLMKRYAQDVALPCVVAAVRAAWIDQAIERGDVAACLRGLAWRIWSWIGLPLFARAYGEVERPLYPHLMDLRSIAQREWYFERHQRIDPAYQADALARAGEAGARFHLYLSGAGGTGKSCFLHHVFDRITDRRTSFAVWYRVDSPNSSWENVEARVREEAIKVIAARMDQETVKELTGIPGGLGDFLHEAAALLCQRDPEFDEIAVFIDQLERTFESGDAPNPARLEKISQKFVTLLQDVGTGEGVRVFVASRKQYLPDFLVSFRAAAKCNLEFNVLQVISDENERIGFVEKVVEWCRTEQLIGRRVTMGDDATRALIAKLDGNPLNMMLALIQLLSQSADGAITADDVRRRQPWSKLFQLDLATAERDPLELYFLLAMSHARTEIVRFEEVWWRIRMVSSALTRRVTDLGPQGVRERLWLLGLLGRTIHARPEAGEPMRYVEFFHANLRDYLLREVMGQGLIGAGNGAGGRDRGTPPAWRALDRLSVFAHDWAQTLQPLLADEIRVLIEHRDEVIATGLAPDDEDGHPFHLLFLRDPDEARKGLKLAAMSCFAYSALVHDEGGRATVELLFEDVKVRAAQCRDWLLRSPTELRLPILRYLITLEDQPARDLLLELLLDMSVPLGDEMAQAAVLVLTEPLSAARWRNGVLLLVLSEALRRVGGDPARLPPAVVDFVVAACGHDRDTLDSVITYCVGRLEIAEDANVKALAPGLRAYRGFNTWLPDASGAPLLAAAAIADREGARSAPLELVLGDALRSTVTAAQLADWSHRLRAAIGLPLPDIVLVRGDVEADEAELRLSGQQASRGVFRPGALRVDKRLWEQSGGPRSPGTYVEGLEGDEDVLWLPAVTIEAARYPYPAHDADGAIVDWIESRCRRSFDQIFDVELLVAFRREAATTAAGRDLVRRISPQLLRLVLLNLVEERVPILSRDAVLEQIVDLAPRVRDAETMTQKIREFLKADICRVVADDVGQVMTILLDERLEQTLADRPANQWISAAETIRLDAAIQRLVYLTRERAAGPPLVLVTVPRLRRALARRLRSLDRHLPVLSFTELDQALIAVPGGLVDIELDPGPQT
jgi:hypothetical protein